MAFIGLFEAFSALFSFLIFYYFLNKQTFNYLNIKKTLQSYPWNWPVLGMLPAVLVRLNKIDEGIAIIEKSNLNFLFKGPWFVRMDVFITVDPANIHYILSSNFSNYVKGSGLRKMFRVYGDAVFNTDSEIWKNMRMASQFIANHQGFQSLFMRTTAWKIKDVLLPILNQFAEEGTVMDLQDVVGRFMYDTTLNTVTGSDPKSLSLEMPEADEFAKALHDAEEAILYRHITPRFMWKLQSMMGLGQAKKMNKAGATFDRVCAKFVSDKREEIGRQSNVESEDILMKFIKMDRANYMVLNKSDDKFFRDIILTFVIAGKDTIASALTWFFWLMSENPKVVAKIREEINTILGQEISSADPSEFLNTLVYLHGALYETMRLYPPIAIERKCPIKPDILPSGHKLEARENIIIPIYALGRMRAVWGEDALEFKPERWISEAGGLRHEPSFKFLAFNAGPRTCIGKHLAMTQMKTVAIEILQNFDIKMVDGHKIEPKLGLILSMRYGLRVTLTKRSSALRA